MGFWVSEFPETQKLPKTGGNPETKLLNNLIVPHSFILSFSLLLMTILMRRQMPESQHSHIGLEGIQVVLTEPRSYFST